MHTLEFPCKVLTDTEGKMPENKLLDLLPEQKKQAQCSVLKMQEYSNKDSLLPATVLNPAPEPGE